MSQIRQMARDAADEIDRMIERCAELEEWAQDWGITGMEHKLQEAGGPLSSASGAARDFADRA